MLNLLRPPTDCTHAWRDAYAVATAPFRETTCMEPHDGLVGRYEVKFQQCYLCGTAKGPAVYVRRLVGG